MATPKSKFGSCCAVASCKNYSSKILSLIEIAEKYNIAVHIYQTKTTHPYEIFE